MTRRQAGRVAWAAWCGMWAAAWAAAAGLAVPHRVCTMQDVMIINGSGGGCMQYGTAGSWPVVVAFALAAALSAIFGAAGLRRV